MAHVLAAEQACNRSKLTHVRPVTIPSKHKNRLAVVRLGGQISRVHLSNNNHHPHYNQPDEKIKLAQKPDALASGQALSTLSPSLPHRSHSPGAISMQPASMVKPSWSQRYACATIRQQIPLPARGQQAALRLNAAGRTGAAVRPDLKQFSLLHK